MDVYQELINCSRQCPSKPGLIFQEKEISFEKIRDQVFRLANVLRLSGLSRGGKCAFYLPNGPEYVYSYLACFCLGAVGVPLDFQLKSDELISCLTHSEANVLIAAAQPGISLQALQEAAPSLEKIFLIGDEGMEFEALVQAMAEASAEFSPEPVHAQDPALIMYTSGTTGRPKGIILSYRHLDGSPQAMRHFVDLTDRDTKLCAIPLSHIAGLIYIQNVLLYRITLVLMKRFNPYEFLKNVARFRITCFHIVPAMYTALLSLKQIDKYDLSSLRWVVVFGAPSSPEILNRFHRYCPNARLLNGWGMTETCPPNTVTPMDSDNIASVGRPSPLCEIAVADDEGRLLPVGETGEIRIRGWVVMDGYYKDPERTASAMRDGWLLTGDLGRFDDEGFLYIAGRKKEMIKVAGQIVFAPEIEAALQGHESVREAAVIGVPDALRGEAVKAFVVVGEEARLSEEELRHYARTHLAHFKVPQSIEFLSDLPRNRTGKVDKERLKQDKDVLETNTA